MRLSKAEKEAIIDVLNEKLAGGANDLRDSLGISNDQAAKLMRHLDSACTKIARTLKRDSTI